MRGSFYRLAAASSGGLGWFGGSEAFQQRTRRLIVGVLGDEFSAEGFGEGGGSQALYGLLRGGETGFDPVGEGEQVLDPADNFLLFGWGGNANGQQPQVFDVNSGVGDPFLNAG